MKTHWILEKDLKEDTFVLDFKNALEERNIGLSTCSYIQLGEPERLKAKIQENKDKFIVPFGSIELCKFFKRYNQSLAPNDRVTMGLFFDLDKLSYLEYSSYWGKYLLNGDAVVTTYAELIRRKDFFYDILGENNAIFIRPVHNDKVFTGRVIYKEEFDLEIQRMGHNFIVGFSPSMQVVISRPKNVHQEWRLAIVNRKIVASTLYYTNQFEDHRQLHDDKVIELANQVLKEEWQPDDVYVLDLCTTKAGNVYVLEIGSLNSAGWYAMDCGAIIDGIENWKNKCQIPIG